MRNYKNFDKFYEELLSDIYPQPQNENEEDEHYLRAKGIIEQWLSIIHPYSVLDAGCGEGFCQPFFREKGIIDYIGITLSEEDFFKANSQHNRNVYCGDFNFLPWSDDFFDLVFARHSLEHSPCPIITLMEWHRVSSRWLGLVIPNPKSFTFVGRNHYSVVENASQIRWWLRRAGWQIIDKRYDDFEYCYLCVKLPRISYEGWAETPLPGKVYEEERDDAE